MYYTLIMMRLFFISLSIFILVIAPIIIAVPLKPLDENTSDDLFATGSSELFSSSSFPALKSSSGADDMFFDDSSQGNERALPKNTPYL